MPVDTLHRRLRWLMYVLALGAVLPAGMDAQRVGRGVEAYIAEGDKLLEEGRVKEARRAYQTALLADRSSLVAQRRLGALAYRNEDWDEVRKRFNNVIERQQDDLEAHYYAGIADREIGRTRPPLVQGVFEWRRARKHFEQVLAQDSTFRDVLYQYAWLQGYRGGHDRWQEAVRLGQTQVRLRPDMVEAQVGLFHLYERFIDRWNDDEVTAWLNAQRTDQARFAVAEIHRKRDELDQAEARYRRMLSEEITMSDVPVYLALARLYAARNQPDSIDAVIDRAVEAVRSAVDAALLFEDVKFLISDEEFRLFRGLTEPEAYRTFFRAFWASRNPTPAAATNPRLHEHYRRLLEADRFFVHYGYQGWVNSPDKLGYLNFPPAYDLNHKYNDKGLVYLRHGPPDDRTATLHPEAAPNESWRYYGGGDRDALTFHFTVDEKTGGGNNWRLTPALMDPLLLQDRLTWGNLYQSLYQATTDPNRGLDVHLLELEMIEETKQDVAAGLASDRHTWRTPPAPISMAYQVNAFRGDYADTRVEVFYLLPLASIAQGLNKTVGTLDVEAGIAVHDMNWQKRAGDLNREAYALPRRPADVVLGAFYFTVPPDSYHVALHARVPGTNALTGWKLDYEIPDLAGTALAMSDVLLAYNIRPAQGEQNFVREDLYVLPNPTQQYGINQRVFVYFEVYNLTFGPEDRTRFNVEYTLTPTRSKRRGFLRRLISRKARPALSLSVERDGSATTSVEFAEIDASNVEPGSYDLSVTITDAITGLQTTRTRPLTLYENEANSP